MKICTVCNTQQPEENFYWLNKAKNKRHSSCKHCHAQISKAAWISGDLKKSNYEAKARRVKKAHDYIWELFKNSKCFDCGEKNPIVFEFDHTGTDKLMDVAKMISSNYGLDKIKAEIAKCDIVCANCHKIRTSTRGNHWRYVRSIQT